MLRLCTLLGLACLAVPAASARAQEIYVLTAGRSAVLVDRPGQASDSAFFRVRGDRELAQLVDPRCPLGSSLQLAVYPAGGDLMVHGPTIELPCDAWEETPEGYLYDDPDAAVGGVRQVRYSRNELEVSLGGPNYQALGGPAAFVQMRLDLGDRRLVTRFYQFETNQASLVVAHPPSPDAAAGEAAFWDTLWGDAERSAEAFELLRRAAASDAGDGRSRFLIGMLHLLRVGRSVVDWSRPNAFAKAQIAGARAAFEAAVPLLWDGTRGDSRVPGFAAAAVYQYGVLHEDPAEIARGLALLEEAVAINPFFNSFDYFSVAPTVQGSDPLYARVLELVDEALRGDTANCVLTQPEFCANAGFAPRNSEGALVLFADLYAKGGRRDDAWVLYLLSALAGTGSGWDYAGLARRRLLSVDARVDRYANGDPTDDPPLLGAGPSACVSCHGR